MAYWFVLSTSLCRYILKRYLAFASGAISRLGIEKRGKSLSLMLRNKQTKQNKNKQKNPPEFWALHNAQWSLTIALRT